MSEKLTHREYVLLRLRAIKEAAEGILNDTVDTTAACRIIFLNWHEAELPDDSEEYLFMTGIDDEFEPFSPDSRDLHNPLPSSQMSEEEKGILKYYKNHIIEACKNILAKYFP